VQDAGVAYEDTAEHVMEWSDAFSNGVGAGAPYPVMFPPILVHGGAGLCIIRVPSPFQLNFKQAPGTHQGSSKHLYPRGLNTMLLPWYTTPTRSRIEVWQPMLRHDTAEMLSVQSQAMQWLKLS
jgi:hypothetical protein